MSENIILIPLNGKLGTGSSFTVAAGRVDVTNATYVANGTETGYVSTVDSGSAGS